MSDVFIAFNKKDESRVFRFIRGLRQEGFDVSWDQTESGGEAWRANIENEINQVGCVVVIWTHLSVGAGGSFVREVAAQGRARSILVPVLLDRVPAPLGFGELHSFDLVHWRGNANDQYFRDTAAAIRAKLDGEPVPTPKAPASRLFRRLTIGGAISAALALAVPFFINFLSLQNQLCTIPIGQPSVSDACGALGIGDRPTREERLAWERLPSGDCEALRNHVARFPKGAYRAQAVQLIEARKVSSTETWIPGQRLLPFYEGRASNPLIQEAAARNAALARALPIGAHLCRDLTASGEFRFESVRVSAEDWTCSKITNGYVCGFQGVAQCSIKERVLSDHEKCGKRG